jgi:hypothetical protein
MANQAIVETEKNLPRGSVEIVPTRQTGREDKVLLSPTQDILTDKRRAHYGDDENKGNPRGENIKLENVNDIKTKVNITRDQVIQGDNSDTGHTTGFGRACVQ